ncbi:hypothetical protein NL676_019223 [Syzygium grande]|nr:hypothetical protein NL676_019223 [Syzygium grande]
MGIGLNHGKRNRDLALIMVAAARISVDKRRRWSRLIASHNLGGLAGVSTLSDRGQAIAFRWQYVAPPVSAELCGLGGPARGLGGLLGVVGGGNMRLHPTLRSRTELKIGGRSSDNSKHRILCRLQSGERIVGNRMQSRRTLLGRKKLKTGIGMIPVLAMQY